jgi:hypothetical protein
MTRTSLLLSALALLALSACHKPNDAAFYNRGGPESLLDVSSEVVTLGVSTPQELEELSRWIDQDQPTRAELYCDVGNLACAKAQQVLDLHGVPSMMVTSNQASVTLIYERVLARDCSQRYVDNSSNPWNTNHAAFGCSLSGNIVQQVSNKQQFINPNLGDIPGARTAIQSYNRAYIPYTARPAYQVEQSLTGKARSN